jgi:hypothetical protein
MCTEVSHVNFMFPAGVMVAYGPEIPGMVRRVWPLARSGATRLYPQSGIGSTVGWMAAREEGDHSVRRPVASRRVVAPGSGALLAF